MRGGMDVGRKNKNNNRPMEQEALTGGAADEVEFGREPGAAADEVIFDEVTPGAPNPLDAVETQGSPADRDVQFGEEARMKHRDDRLREEDVEAAAEVTPVTDPGRGEREQNETQPDQGNVEEEGNGLGITSIILSVLSFFFVPFLLGSAGIILGIIAGRRGSTLGWWAVGLGAVSVILTAFVAPIAGF